MRAISLVVLAVVLGAGCGKVQHGVCSAGRTDCDQSCVDLQSDSQHCGACGTVCAATETCVQGSCAVWCPAGFTVCDDQCYDLRSDVSRCGTCDHMCTAAEACVAGQCSALACPLGLTDCGAGCIDVRVSDEHCGGCNMPCMSGSICVSAACVPPPTCASGCAPGQLCVSGTCVCPTGQVLCGGVCVNRQVDAGNCGTCGHACVFGEECIAGMCTPTCGAQLFAPVSDAWGLPWDGIDRTPLDFADATKACGDLGGRLPLSGEMYRTGLAQTGLFQNQTANLMWTSTPYDPFAETVIVTRFSDAIATTSNIVPGTVRPFRCVCPPPPKKEFTGNSCYGPPGGECFALSTTGKRVNIDRFDRAPLPKGAAMYECLQARGRIADYITIAEAIRAGLPNGGATVGGPWVHTADDARHELDTAVKWNGVETDWVVSANTTVVGTGEYRPFRCAGINYDSGTHPNTVANEFVGSLLYDKGETMDNPSATWVAAHDICYNRGGHLTRSAELASLVMQGLPNGSDVYLWGADQASYDGAQFLGVGLAWKDDGKKLRYLSAGTNGIQWAYKSDAGHVFRCIYYPLDQMYAGPSESDCNGGCFKLTLPGATAPALMWFDNNDRGAAILETAIDTCRTAGGHLASERDLTEAIRHGLPNGSGTNISTWDIGYGAGTGIAGTRFMIVKWTAVETGFTDQYSTYMTNADLTNATLGFRCMWTNELRY